MERRLTAILAADAVGYSKFMGTDEEAAFEALVERREIIDATIEEQEGRIFGSAGDSVIAEFSSSVKAARCAVEIQKQLGILNFQQSENRRMVFRVGVHTGDVIVKNGDLLGDGVNVAARIEGLAPAGGVAISAQVAEQIAGKPVARFERAGKHKLKNIARAREIWCWPPEAAETIRGHSRTWRIQMMTAIKAMAATVVFGLGVGYVNDGALLPDRDPPHVQASLTAPAGRSSATDINEDTELSETKLGPDVFRSDPDIARKLQAALIRVGCGAGTVDGVWGRQSQGALEEFARRAGLVLPSAAVSEETLALFEPKKTRVCPTTHQFAERRASLPGPQRWVEPLRERQRGVPYSGMGVDCDFVSNRGEADC